MSIEFSKSKNYFVPGVETLFGELAIRLNVTVEQSSMPTS